MPLLSLLLGLFLLYACISGRGRSTRFGGSRGSHRCFPGRAGARGYNWSFRNRRRSVVLHLAREGEGQGIEPPKDDRRSGLVLQALQEV